MKLYASKHVYGVKEEILSENAPSEIVAKCIPQMKSCGYDVRLEVGELYWRYLYVFISRTW